MIYGYARVSTKGQARDGNSLDRQAAILKEAGGATKIYYDSFTGRKMDKLKSVLKNGDKLIVTKLDRFARSAAQGSQLMCFFVLPNFNRKEQTLYDGSRKNRI